MSGDVVAASTPINERRWQIEYLDDETFVVKRASRTPYGYWVDLDESAPLPTYVAALTLYRALQAN